MMSAAEPAAGQPLQGFGGFGDQRGAVEGHAGYPGHDGDPRAAIQVSSFRLSYVG
jgi:hypothetical protein